MTPPLAEPNGEPSSHDPAVGLLDRLVRDALDQGYLEAAARRAASPLEPSAGSSRTRQVVAAAGLALVGLLVTVAAVQHQVGAPEAAQRKQELAGAIADADARLDGLESQLAAASAEVVALRQSALSSNAEGRAVQAQIDRLGPSVGTVAVSGPGVVVTVDDAPPDADAIAAGEPDLGRILDRDLQLLVNGLWQSGAEAIDINGQRLTSLTAIRGAGGAVLVNYRPLERPYVVTAIGDPATLGPLFRAGSGGVELETLRQTYGVRYELQTKDQLTVPEEQGLMLRYAKEDLG